MNQAAGNTARLTSIGGKWIERYWLECFLAETDYLYGGMLKRLSD